MVVGRRCGSTNMSVSRRVAARPSRSKVRRAISQKVHGCDIVDGEEDEGEREVTKLKRSVAQQKRVK